MTLRPHLSRLEAPASNRRLLFALLAALMLPVLLVVGAFCHFWSTAGELADHQPAEPSRLYAAPLDLGLGDRVERSGLLRDLESAGYRQVDHAPLHPGDLDWHGDTLRLALLPGESGSPSGGHGGERVEAELRGGRVTRLSVAGESVADGGRIAFGRPLLFSYYDAERREHRAARLEELPPHVVNAVLAAEDAGFFRHSGVAPLRILRAAWTDLRAGEVRQGGSTITQQVVKNLYLTPERSFARKAREAILAVLVEARHSKRKILQAYLDETYWGNVDGKNLYGIGAAALSYYGKDARRLDLQEAATLAGMIHSPKSSPLADPQAARKRRDWVLSRMERRRWISPEQAAAARQSELATRATNLSPQRAPYFAAAMAAEARQRFGVERLAGTGLRLDSTLVSADQRAAEQELARGLDALGGGGAGDRLQAALVSLEPRSGRILAWVGGRSWAESQFDRVTQAHRQAGSAFKPIVYAAALAEGRLSPWELLSDTPIAVRYDRNVWRPRNSDNRFHGMVTAREALERSLNVPTVRVAVRTGLPRIAELGHRMGISSPLPAVPSLALGSCEVTPLEIATVYATLAADGHRATPWGLERVTGADGELEAEPLPEPQRVLHHDVTWQLTSMLRGVVDRGTAWRARAMGVQGAVAGKTGTTDDQRDSWFAGYTSDRATVVWVGRDDAAPTGLTGTTGALPLWSRFVARAGSRVPRVESVPPGDFVTVEIDPQTGQLATPLCPRRVREEVARWDAPLRPCELHVPPQVTSVGYEPIASASAGTTLSEMIAGGAETPQVRLRDDVTGFSGSGTQIQIERGRSGIVIRGVGPARPDPSLNR